MKSTQKGLRDGDILKDTYDRLECSQCDIQLTRRDDSDGVGAIRECPECGRKWRQLT